MVILSDVNLIHKSNIYFNVVNPMVKKSILSVLKNKGRMHHGEIFISNDQILLHDKKHWYRANIQDIKDIKTLNNQKQIQINFNNYDMVLFCKEYSQLLAIRDFLNLLQGNFRSNN